MDLEFHQLEMGYEHLRVRRPERERRLLASLAEAGQQVPIVVVPLVEDLGRYQVIDGYSRVRLLKKLGADTVRATVWDMSEAEALVLDRSLRTADRETAIEQGWLLQVLRNLPLSYEEMAKRFDRSVNWVSQRLSLVDDLPPGVQELIRAGRIPAQAAMKSLVPMARKNRDDCEAFAYPSPSTTSRAERSGTCTRLFGTGHLTYAGRSWRAPSSFSVPRGSSRSPLLHTLPYRNSFGTSSLWEGFCAGGRGSGKTPLW